MFVKWFYPETFNWCSFYRGVDCLYCQGGETNVTVSHVEQVNQIYGVLTEVYIIIKLIFLTCKLYCGMPHNMIRRPHQTDCVVFFPLKSRVKPCVFRTPTPHTDSLSYPRVLSLWISPSSHSSAWLNGRMSSTELTSSILS